MVKDDSLYIIAIVAVVAVIGLVIMSTGSSSTVVVAEDLPSMVEDSDSTAIAGQAIRSNGKIQRPPYADSNDISIMQKVKPDLTITDSDGDGAINAEILNSIGAIDAEIIAMYLKSLSEKELQALGLHCPAIV